MYEKGSTSVCHASKLKGEVNAIIQISHKFGYISYVMRYMYIKFGMRANKLNMIFLKKQLCRATRQLGRKISITCSKEDNRILVFSK